MVDLSFLNNETLLGKILLPLLIIVATVIVAKIVKLLVQKTYHSQANWKVKRFKIEETHYVFARRFIVTIIYIMGFILVMLSIPELRTLSYSLLAGAGIAAVVIGFATKDVFSNIMSGVIIAISQPFRVGDRVNIQNQYGIIEDITLRHTVIRTWENKRLIVPNSIINNEAILNYSIGDEKIMGTVEMGISYDSDIDFSKKLMKEEALKHPDLLIVDKPHDYIPKEDDVTVRVMECGDFAVKLRLYYWAKDHPTAWVMERDLIEAIKKRFDKEGVEIPFPYRTVVYKKDLEKKPKKRRK